MILHARSAARHAGAVLDIPPAQAVDEVIILRDFFCTALARRGETIVGIGVGRSQPAALRRLAARLSQSDAPPARRR